MVKSISHTYTPWIDASPKITLSDIRNIVMTKEIVFRNRAKPLFETNFSLPSSKVIDRKLVTGSALFGIGWGIAGFCPGGAIPALGLGYKEAFLFVLAMTVGILIARQFNNRVLMTVRA